MYVEIKEHHIGKLLATNQLSIFLGAPSCIVLLMDLTNYNL